MLSTSSFNVAITTLSRDAGIGQERAQWAVTGFMVLSTVVLLAVLAAASMKATKAD